MELLHGLVLYDHPRKGIFRYDIDKYDPEFGWLDEEKEAVIIGEDNHFYITKTLRKNTYWLTPDLPPLKGDFLTGIGFNKDKLVKWV